MIPIQSLTENPRYLQDAKSPCFPIPDGQEIIFTEYAQDKSVSSRQARLSQIVGSAAEMSFLVNQEVFEDEVLLEIFWCTLFGGFSPTLQTKVLPWAHPYLAGPQDDNRSGWALWAKDIVGLTPVYFDETPADQVYSTYNFVLVKINFQTLDYPVDLTYTKAGVGVTNPNWRKITSENSSNRIATPLGFYKFQGGAYSGYPANFGAWFTVPYTNLIFTFYHVPHSVLFGGSDTNFKPVYSQFCGQVNQVAMGGCGAEKLLLDSGAHELWFNVLGQPMYNVRLYVIYNENGFNKQVDPGGSVSPVGFAFGGARPFQTFAMSQLFNLLNPL